MIAWEDDMEHMFRRFRIIDLKKDAMLVWKAYVFRTGKIVPDKVISMIQSDDEELINLGIEIIKGYEEKVEEAGQSPK